MNVATASRFQQIWQPIRQQGSRVIRGTCHYGGRGLGTAAGGGISVLSWCAKGISRGIQKFGKLMEGLSNKGVIQGRKLTGKSLGERLSKYLNKDIIFKKWASFTRKAPAVAGGVLA